MDSDSSAGSSNSPYLLTTPYFATKQRVGSLRSRLRKQHPILQSDSEANPEFFLSSMEKEEGTQQRGARITTQAETHEPVASSARSSWLPRWSTSSEVEAAVTRGSTTRPTFRMGGSSKEDSRDEGGGGRRSAAAGGDGFFLSVPSEESNANE